MNSPYNTFAAFCLVYQAAIQNTKIESHALLGKMTRPLNVYRPSRSKSNIVKAIRPRRIVDNLLVLRAQPLHTSHFARQS